MKIQRRSVLDDQKVIPRHSWWRAVLAGEPALADVVIYIVCLSAIFGVFWMAFFLYAA